MMTKRSYKRSYPKKAARMAGSLFAAICYQKRNKETLFSATKRGKAVGESEGERHFQRQIFGCDLTTFCVAWIFKRDEKKTLMLFLLSMIQIR